MVVLICKILENASEYVDPVKALPHLQAAVAAAKHAAALGCSDAEVEMAGQRALDVASRGFGWRSERGGIDEPVAWVARALDSGRVRKLLEAPDETHDVEEWTPWMDEASSGITLAHVYALYSRLDKGLAKDLGGSQAYVLYVILYHLLYGKGKVSPPTHQSEKVLKSLHTRVGRQMTTYQEERKRAMKRRDQS